MKTWRELKPGDKIYYWDKGKLHEQIVHVAELKVETQTYKDWNGKVTENKREIMHIEAGKNSRTKVDLKWYLDCSNAIFCYMPRFACLEAANHWVKMQRDHYQRKVNKLEKNIERYKKILNRYDISAN